MPVINAFFIKEYNVFVSANVKAKAFTLNIPLLPVYMAMHDTIGKAISAKRSLYQSKFFMTFLESGSY